MRMQLDSKESLEDAQLQTVSLIYGWSLYYFYI